MNGPDWLKESIGQVTHKAFGIESQNFADMINVGIANTMISGEPLYQHIRTLVRDDGQDPFWVSYERLLTCHMTRGGVPVVIADIFPTQYVDVSIVGGP